MRLESSLVLIGKCLVSLITNIFALRLEELEKLSEDSTELLKYVMNMNSVCKHLNFCLFMVRLSAQFVSD